MNNKFFKNKFLIFLVFFICSFCFFSSVKADNERTITCNGKTYIIPDDVPERFFIVNSPPYNETRLYFTDSIYTDFCPIFQKDADTVLKIWEDKYCNNSLSFKWYAITLNGTDFTKGKLCDSLGGNWSSLGTMFNPDTDFIYSTNDIYKTTGNYKVSNVDDVFFKGTKTSIKYSIELSTNYSTSRPVVAYSNYFDYSDVKKYECYISTDSKTWTLMNYETFNDTVNNITKFRFNYKIYKNGCYYFKFLNKETNEDYYLSYNITNIVKNSSNSGFTESGIPQPFCTYERVGDEFVIKTQSFSADDMQRFRCFYTKSPGDNYSSWDEMSMGSSNNTLTGETEYYFFFTVPKDSEDCIYYFVFYDNNSHQYGSPSSMNCYFDKMNQYADSLYPTVSEKNSRFNDLLKYFKERFGFLTYPFEFLVNFANRIFNINYSEPIIHIPELREPVNGNIIFNGLDFNFNSLLDNNTFVYIYNIYLVAIDFIIVVLFIFLCKKEIEEVFGNG